MRAMDWLDKLSIVAIVIISVTAIVMLADQALVKRHNNNPGSETEEKSNPYALKEEANKQIYGEVTSYMGKGLYGEAMSKLEDIVKMYPDNPQSYVYLARVHLKQGRLGESLRNYRIAVEMEPDYVDERTPLFIGDEIEDLVEEGREKFGREKDLKPEDEEVRKTLKDIYYIQRRLAGGCE
jgi:tetratricopeptide (TPR) repeat protein